MFFKTDAFTCQSLYIIRGGLRKTTTDECMDAKPVPTSESLRKAEGTCTFMHKNSKNNAYAQSFHG